MKTIVIYYSYDNHTRMIAERIKKELSCDILEIKSKVPYSKNYDEVVSMTEDNLQTRKTKEIEDIDIELENYDKVILGTPVWWYTITPPIRTFLKSYNLNGKIVIPFATNAGWLGSTFEEIKGLCNGKVINEMSIKFTTDHSEDKLVTTEEEINNWINKIKEN